MSIDKKKVAKKNKRRYTSTMSLSLTNDFIFKHVFGKEENLPLLLTLVNAVLEDSGFEPIIQLTLQKTEVCKDADWLKIALLDVCAKDESGAEYDIEIQIPFERSFRSRSLYYWAKLYAEQLAGGTIYEELKPVICINFLDFVLFADTNQFHTCFMLADKHLPDSVLTEDLQIHFIELPKARQFSGRLAELAHLIRNAAPNMEDEMNVLLKKDPLYQKMYDEYTHCLDDPNTRSMALSREMFARDQASRIHDAVLDGREQGIEQGIKQGIKQGIQKGIQQTKIEMAQKLLSAGTMSEEEIARITGLTIEEIGDRE